MSALKIGEIAYDIKDKVNELTKKMNDASEQLLFEQAKEYRDLIQSIKYVTSKI